MKRPRAAEEVDRLGRENALLARELAEARQQQAAAADILKTISRSAFDLPVVLDALVATAARLCGATFAGIFLRHGDRMRGGATIGLESKDVAEFMELSLPIDSTTVSGRVIRSGQIVNVADIEADAGYDLAGVRPITSVRSMMGVPLLRHGKAEGAFFLGRLENEAFSKRHCELVQTFADQAVIAIENARLFEEVQKRTGELSESLEHQTATAEVLKSISRSAFDLQTVLDTLAESAARLCAADFAFMYRLTAEEGRIAASYGVAEEDAPLVASVRHHPGRGSVAQRILLEHKTVHVPDFEADPEYTFVEVPRKLGLRAIVGVPLLRDGALIGLLLLARKSPGPFAPKQIELCETFADQAVIAIENARLFEEVQARNRELSEALEQQTATGTILRAIAASPTDIQPVLKTVAESAAKLLDAYDAVITLRTGDTLSGAAHWGPLPFITESFPVERGYVSGRAVIERSPVHVHDVSQAESEFPGSAALAKQTGPRTMLAVPLLREQEAIGTILMRRREVRPFAEKQIDLLKTFADQAVIAIENVRLFEEVQARTRELTEALEYQTATSDVLGVISRSPSQAQPVLDTIVATSGHLCEADYAFVFMRKEEGKYHIEAAHPADTTHLNFLKANPVSPDRGTAAGRAALERRTVHIPDAAADPEYARSEWLKLSGTRTYLGVPLLRDGDPIGVIAAARKRTEPFTARQIELITTFADQAVIAIENARLFEEVQARTRDLTEALQQQTATAEVLKAISRSTFDLQAVLDTLVASAARLSNFKHAALYLRDGEMLRGAAFVGARPEEERASLGQILAVDCKTISGRVMLSGKPEFIPDIQVDADYDYAPVKDWSDARALMAVPLLRDGRVEGVFSVARSEPGAFSERQCDLIQTFADQAVIAIENVRLFEEVRARTRELTESLEHQTATGEILASISGSMTDARPVFHAIVRNLNRLFSTNYAVLQLLRDGMVEMPVVHGDPDLERLMQHYPRPLDDSTVGGRAMLTKQAVQVAPVLDNPAAPPATQEFAREFGFNSVIFAPMLQGGKVIGAIGTSRREAKPFNEKQLALIKSFADQAVIAIENARLFEEVQARTRDLGESLQQQTATADVLKVISRSVFDLDSVLEALIKSAVNLCRAKMGGIFLPSGQFFSLAAQVGMPRELVEYELRNPFAPERGTVTGRAVLTRSVVHIPDVLADPEYTYTAGQKIGDYRAMLGVPLIRDDEVIGVFSVARLAPGPFAPREIELVQTFADQAVMAIGNVRLFEEVQQRTAELGRSVGELRALGEVSQAVNSTLDLKTVLETIVAKAVQLSETDAGAIYVFNKAAQKFRLRATYGMSEELIAAISGQAIGLNDAGVGEAARLRAPVQVSDLSKTTPSPTQKIVLDAGYRGVLVVPLLRPNKIVGALVVRRKTPGLFQDSTVHLMETFAAQSVLAIQNARLFNEIEEKGHQLEIASRHKSQFLANMSHELRTPLNSVLGFSEMLADGLYGELPEKAKATLARIQVNGKHLLGLINDVLDLAKIEAGQLTLTIDDYSIGQIVKTVAATTEPLARTKGLKLTATVAEGLPMGRGDERRLSQVLLNLAGNAVKFTDKGSIDIAANARDGHFEVLVRDTGPGIAPEHQSRIFEEFQQIDESSTRQKGGTGLGLAISKRIVEMHGGTIGLDSTPGSGSTFRIAIPVKAGESVKAA